MRLQGLALALLLGSAMPAKALTLKEAQTLPLPQLAHLVLGDVGAMMVDVDRPPHTLRFYERPTAAEVGFGSWTGMCQSMVVEPYYDQHWALTRFSTAYRYGAPRGMRDASQANWTKASTETQATCHQTGDVRHFFEASEPLSAFRGLAGLQMFEDAAQNENPLPFRFSCQKNAGSPQDCSSRTSAAELAKVLDFRRISRIRAVNCKNGIDDETVAPYARHVCYSVDLDRPGVQYFIEMAAADPADKLGNDEQLVFIRYTEAQVVY